MDASRSGSGTHALPRTVVSRAGKARWVLVVFLLGLVLLAIGPSLVARSAYRHEFPRTRMKGFQNRIEVGSASLGWFSPAVLRDVKFFDNEGQPFLEVGETRDERTLLQQLLHPGGAPRLSTRDTLITVRLRPDGSNVEEALRPVREYAGKRPPEPERMHSTGATLRIIETATGQTTEWRDADLIIVRPSAPTVPHTLELTARPANGPEGARLAVKANWLDGENGSPREVNLDVDGEGLPLADLKPLARQFTRERPLPEFDLGGTAGMTLKGKLPRGLAQPPAGDLAGSLTLNQLSFAMPELLGEDRLESAQTTLRFDLGSTGTETQIRSLALQSETTQFSGQGTVALGDSAGTVIDPVTFQGNINLGKLAHLLPHTVKLPDNTRLDAGELTFELHGTPGQTPETGNRWTLAAGTPLIQATLATGEAVEWKSPVDIQLVLQQHDTSWRCETLQVKTPLLTLRGEPSDQGLHLTGDADLARLLEQLQIPLDRDTTSLTGTMVLSGDIGWPKEGQMPVSTQVALRDIELRRLMTRYEERAIPRNVAPGDAADSAPPRPGQEDSAPPAPGLDEATGSQDNAAPPQPGLDDETPPERPAGTPAGTGLPRPGFTPRAPQPIPLLGGPADRRAQRAATRAANQADRAARRDARRDALAEQRAEREAQAAARAAERDSINYERVPIQEWKTLFHDPQVSLTSQVNLDLSQKVLTIARAELITTGVTSTSQGEVSQLLSGNVIHLQGQISTRLGELAQVLARESPVPLEMEGEQVFQFQVDGPLREPEVAVTGGWERAAAAGLVAGPARFTAGFRNRVLELQPASFSLSGGEMHVGGRLDLAKSPLTVEIPAGPVCSNVALTQSICNGWMQYIAPMVSQAARAEGIFSLSLDDTGFTPQDLAHAQLSGRLEIPVGRVLPGPIFEQLGQLIAPIEAAARRGGLMGDLLSTEKPLAVMQDQVIDFELHDGRIHHTPALVELRKVAISTSGSVGLDQSLDITAVLLFPTEWVQRLPFLAGPQGQGLVIPVGGTLKKPRVEPGTARRILKELGTGALGDLLDGVLPGNLPLPRLPFPRMR